MVIFHCYVSSPEGKSPTRSIVSVSKKNGWDSPPWKNSQKIWSPRKGMQDSLTGFLAPTGLAIPGVPGVLWKCWKLVYHCFAVNFCAFHNSKYFRLGQLWRFSRNITTYKYIQLHICFWCPQTFIQTWMLAKMWRVNVSPMVWEYLRIWNGTDFLRRCDHGVVIAFAWRYTDMFDLTCTPNIPSLVVKSNHTCILI